MPTLFVLGVTAAFLAALRGIWLVFEWTFERGRKEGLKEAAESRVSMAPKAEAPVEWQKPSRMP